MTTTADIELKKTRRRLRFAFWTRTYAVMVKEFIQLRRDRVSFADDYPRSDSGAFAVWLCDKHHARHPPTAVLLQEHSDLSRSIVAALRNTRYFDITQLPRNETELDHLLVTGQVLLSRNPGKFRTRYPPR